MSPRKRRGEKTYYRPEQRAAAAELDLNPEQDTLLMKLAHDMCRPESLPKNWTAEYVEELNKRKYTNNNTLETTFEHPLIGYYKGAIYLERGGYERLVQNAKTYPPQPQDVKAMAAYLGIRQDEHPFVVAVAQMAISAPLPHEWIEVVDRQCNVSYRNEETGEETKLHPLDSYFIELRNRRRKDAHKKTAQERTRNSTASLDYPIENEDTQFLIRSGHRTRPRASVIDNQDHQSNTAVEDEESELGADLKAMSILDTSALDKIQIVNSYWKIDGTKLQWCGGELAPETLSSWEQDGHRCEVEFDAVVEDSAEWIECVFTDFEKAIEKRPTDALSSNLTSPCFVVAHIGGSTSSTISSRISSLCKRIVSDGTDYSIRHRSLLFEPENTNSQLFLTKNIEYSPMIDSATSEVDATEVKDIEALQLKLRSLDNQLSERRSEYVRLDTLEFIQNGQPAVEKSVCFVDLICPAKRATADGPVLTGWKELALFQLLYAAQDRQLSEASNEAKDGCHAFIRSLKYLGIDHCNGIVFSFSFDDIFSRADGSLACCCRLKSCLASLQSHNSEHDAKMHRIRIEIMRASLNAITVKEVYYKKQYTLLQEQLRDVCGKVRQAINMSLDSEDNDEMDEPMLVASALEIAQSWLRLKRDQEHKLTTLHKELGDLKASTDQLSAENTELKSSLTISTAAVVESEHSNQQAQTELIALQKALVNATQRIKEQTTEFELLQSEMDALKQKWMDTKSSSIQLKGYENEIQYLTTERDQLREAHSNSQQELTELKQKHVSLKDQISELEAEAKKQVAERTALKDDLASCRSNKLELDIECSTLRDKVALLTQEIHSVSVEKEKNKTMSETAQNATAEIAATMQKLHKESEGQRERIKQLEKQDAAYKESISRLNVELAEKEKDYKELKSQLQLTNGQKAKLLLLEKDKALLLDKLEAIVGKPMGDVYDETPPMQTPFQMKTVEGRIAKDNCTTEQALSSIARIVRLAYSALDSPRPRGSAINGGSNGSNRCRREEHPRADATEVVMRVRGLKAERDELRRRDRISREENIQLKKRLKSAEGNVQKPSDSELLNLADRLDQIIGIQSPSHISIIERLRVSINGVFLVHDEVQSLQRQHQSVSFLLKQEERRCREKERELKYFRKIRGRDSESVERRCVSSVDYTHVPDHCHHRHDLEIEQLRDELRHYASVSGKPSHDMIGSAALRYARSKDHEILCMEQRIAELEQEIDRWKKPQEQRARHPDGFKNEMLMWKSYPSSLHRHYAAGIRNHSRPRSPVPRLKTLPPITQSTEMSKKNTLRRSSMPAVVASKSNDFDCRPVPAEVQAKLNRVQDKLLRDTPADKVDKDGRQGDVIEGFLNGDSRDFEITNLKIRLVRAERERTEMATRAINDKRNSQIKLQQATRIISQTQQLTKQLKEVFTGIPPKGKDGRNIMSLAASMLDSYLAKIDRLKIE